MTQALFGIGVALLTVAASAVFIVWFSGYAASVSEKRMLRMLAHAGVAPGLSGHDDTWAIMHVARARCVKCPSTDLCDRWLARNVEGDNSFCRNARTFHLLERITKRIATSSCSGRAADATACMPGARNAVRTGFRRDLSDRLLCPSIRSPIAAVL